MALTFEWDVRKEASNLKKHGVSFKEASTVFGDGSCPTTDTQWKKSVLPVGTIGTRSIVGGLVYPARRRAHSSHRCAPGLSK